MNENRSPSKKSDQKKEDLAFIECVNNSTATIAPSTANATNVDDYVEYYLNDDYYFNDDNNTADYYIDVFDNSVYGRTFVSSGTILSKNKIITRASSFQNQTHDHFVVVAGIHEPADIKNSTRRLTIADITIHPDFDGAKHDVAIITLENALDFAAKPFGPKIGAARLPEKDWFQQDDKKMKVDDRKMNVTGWGSVLYNLTEDPCSTHVIELR